MPHISVSTSQGLSVDWRALLSALTEALSLADSVEPRSIKAYGQEFGNWMMGEGAKQNFVHCEIKLLEGRTTEWRTELADRMYAVLRSQFPEVVDAQFTLEVHEMARATYRKG
jgi:5-carboxymethyl-2-hydroxymuconate isomerase